MNDDEKRHILQYAGTVRVIGRWSFIKLWSVNLCRLVQYARTNTIDIIIMRRYLDKGIDYIAIDTYEGQFAIDTSIRAQGGILRAVCSLIANDIAKFELAELVKTSRNA